MTDYIVLKEFRQFGQRSLALAILTIIGIAIPVARFAAFIVLLVILANIKRINKELEDKRLEKFRTKIINSFVVLIISTVIMGIAVSIATFQVRRGIDWIYLLIPINIAIYSMILLFKSILMQKKAWHKLNKFFKKNADLFPEEISREIIDGTDKLEKSCKYLLYIVTIPVAIVYTIIGYFNLASLRNLPAQKIREKTPSKPTRYEEPPKFKPLSEPKVKATYCVACGNRRDRMGRYCALCGYDMGQIEMHS